MLAFGSDNCEIALGCEPFLLGVHCEPQCSGRGPLRFIIALSAKGEKGCELSTEEKPKIAAMLAESYPIYPDENNLYEISFDEYILYQTRSEFYSCDTDSELSHGRYLTTLEHSALLDCLPEFISTDLVKACCPDDIRHYRIYCQLHIIDIISQKAPIIRSL
jgi:hypothetical protein